MNSRECNILITKAALIDPRLKRKDLEEQADMATAWAEILDEVEVNDAMEALRRHYRTSGYALMPVHVISLSDEIGSERIQRRHQVAATWLKSRELGSFDLDMEAIGARIEAGESDDTVASQVEAEIVENKRRRDLTWKGRDIIQGAFGQFYSVSDEFYIGVAETPADDLEPLLADIGRQFNLRRKQEEVEAQ